MSFYDRYLKNGQRVWIGITWGVQHQIIEAKVIEYLGNDEYDLKATDGNRYIRHIDDISYEIKEKE